MEYQEQQQRPVVVVGGGAAGMSCAARLRRRSEKQPIVVLDAGAVVSAASCGLPYHLNGEIPREEDLTVQTPRSLRASLNLDVRTGCAVTEVDPAAQTVTYRDTGGEERTLRYKDLVLTPGVSARKPPIPGIDSERVHVLRTVDDAVAMRRRVECAQLYRAVVLGAGFIGLEVVETLRDAGLDVTLVELGPQVLPPLNPELVSWLDAELEARGVTVRTSTTVESISQPEGAGAEGDAVEVVLSSGETVTADLVCVAAGIRPATDFLKGTSLRNAQGFIPTDEFGRTESSFVWAAGDATLAQDAVSGDLRSIALGGPANRAGRILADNIAGGRGKHRSIPPQYGTAILRLGALTVAMTGANQAAAVAGNMDAVPLHLHPNNHAGYFPDAKPIHLTVHMATGTGRVIGAQAVGSGDGVDKRIDVLATAIAAGFTVEDLQDLDLCYSPPYGSAKDPVNFAGYLGQNVLERQVVLWYADQYATESPQDCYLDVRSRREHEADSLPGTLNVPHTEVRSRVEEIKEWAQGRTVRTLCATGIRSYNAHRVLTANGIPSASLSGGLTSFRARYPTDAEDTVAPTEELLPNS